MDGEGQGRGEKEEKHKRRGAGRTEESHHRNGLSGISSSIDASTFTCILPCAEDLTISNPAMNLCLLQGRGQMC